MSSDQTQSTSLWEQDIFRFNREEAKASTSFRGWLSTSPSDLGRYLADVTKKSPAGCFDLEDVATLEKLIVRSCSRRADAILPLGILSKIIYQLNRRYQKSIPQPRYVFSLKRETNPLVPENDLAHKTLQLCFSLERNWVASLSPFRDATIKDGRSNIPPELVVFSAALYGGILDIDVAVALYDALQAPERHFRCSDLSSRVYVDLSVAAEGMADQELRRWYPNDKLICLIARTAMTSVVNDLGQPVVERRRTMQERIWAAVSQEFSRQMFDSEMASELDVRYLPKSLGHLLDRVRIVMHSEIPSVLVEYAARKLDCRSLLPPSITRIYGDPSVGNRDPSDASSTDGEKDVDTDNVEAYGGDLPTDIEPPWLPKLRWALRGEDDAAIRTHLENLEKVKDPDLPRKRIVSFALRLAQKGTTSGNPLHPSSLRCCALTVARRIGRVIGAQDPAQYSSSTLETLYQSVLHDAGKDSSEPRGLQRTVAWTLREFQRYLVSECHGQSIDEAEVFRFSRGLLPVDARIISVDDVFKVMAHLEVKSASTESPKRRKNYQIAQAEIVLGFFGGLRRMEGLGLPRLDYQPGPDAEVIVRTTETRHLKTANATRRIPLGVMTTPFPEFLKFLDAAFRSSREGDAASQALLFHPASDDVIIPIIHRALQSVTGDRKMHYHSLRHSFCNWTLLRLMLADLAEIPDLFPHLEKTKQFLQASREFRTKIYGNARTGDHLWYLSSLMGHATPGMSLSGYAHCCDLLLGSFLSQSEVFGSCDDSDFRTAMPQCKAEVYKLLPVIDSGSARPKAASSASLQKELARKAFIKRIRNSTSKTAVGSASHTVF